MEVENNYNKILIIDDDEFIRKSFNTFLSDYGFDVISASSGIEGLYLLKTTKPDIVLLDLRMPGMDGLEVLAEIRKISVDIPVLVISGTGKMDTVIAALRLGAWDYIEKPLPNLDILSYAINKAMERMRLIKENEEYRNKLENLIDIRTKELQTANVELDYINDRLKHIVEAINHMTEVTSIKELCSMLLKEISRNMAANGGSIYLLDNDCFKLCFSLDPDHSPEIIKFPLKKSCLFDRAIDERQPVIFNKLTEKSDIIFSGWKGYKSDSALIIPVLGENDTRPVAIISLHDKINHSFTLQDLEIAQILVSYAFKAISAVKAREELLTNEKKFRAIVENFHGGVFIIDDNYRFLYTNKELCNMLGDPSLDLTGKDFRSYISDEVIDLVIDRYKRRQKGEYIPIKYEIILNRLNGEKRNIELSSTVVKNNDGKMETYGQIIDITERKEAEASLITALKEVESLKNILQDENIYLREEIKNEYNFEEIIGQSASLKRVINSIELIAPNDSTILIHGETGTGKELFARIIHEMSPRKNRPLVKVNCAALPANLIESELFGHEKGAFTGATGRRKGRFELASGGTLFLDEIGELPIELQTKLLRVLQEGEFERVGGEDTIQTNVRIITATNRNLQEAIKQGKFRSDLFYRLNVIPIEIPPLRERKEDIPTLAMFFANKYGRRLGKYYDSLSDNALNQLMSLDWPGNVRELENIIERAVVFCDGPVLEITQPLIFGNNSEKKETTSFLSLTELEKRHIKNVLNETNWLIDGRKGAAKILGLHPNTLRSRMQKLGIKKEIK